MIGFPHRSGAYGSSLLPRTRPHKKLGGLCFEGEPCFSLSGTLDLTSIVWSAHRGSSDGALIYHQRSAQQVKYYTQGAVQQPVFNTWITATARSPYLSAINSLVRTNGLTKSVTECQGSACATFLDSTHVSAQIGLGGSSCWHSDCIDTSHIFAHRHFHSRQISPSHSQYHQAFSACHIVAKRTSTHQGLTEGQSGIQHGDPRIRANAAEDGDGAESSGIGIHSVSLLVFTSTASAGPRDTTSKAAQADTAKA